LSSLGFEEQGSKKQKRTPNKKTRVSTRRGNTSKRSTKEHEYSPVARETKSSKIRLILHQEEEIKESEFSTSKKEFVGYDKVYTRRMTRKIAQELQKVKIETETKNHDRSVDKPPMKR
jgi:hypothetical protein